MTRIGRMVLAGNSVLLLAAALVPAVAMAQAPGSGLASNYAANADKPINIEADSLEVDDKKKVAVFTGNVTATQGDFSVRAKEIQVSYTQSAKGEGDKAEPAKKAASGPIPGGGGAEISRIDAKGKVLVKNKDTQTATGDWAIFEVKKQVITMGGEVVLSEGANTIKGSRLVIDLTTGLSRFDTAAAKDGGEGGSSGRLQMIFTPKSRSGEGAAN
jgi:lipopolysaccharide export system protein LptA